MDEKDLNELLECAVCLERLDHNNKVLPCQHTFCKKCLQDIVLSKQELHCPECRILVDTPIDDLPSNILLARLLEGLNTRKRKLSCETQTSPPKRAKTDLIKPQQQQNTQILKQPSTSGVQKHCCVKSSNRQNKPDHRSKISSSIIDDLDTRINDQNTKKRKLSIEKQVSPKQDKKVTSAQIAAYILKQQQNAQILQQPSTSGEQYNCSFRSTNRPDHRSSKTTSITDDLDAIINDQSTKKRKLSIEKHVSQKQDKKVTSAQIAAYILKQQQNAQVCQQQSTGGMRLTSSFKIKNRPSQPDQISDNVSRFKITDADSKINANVCGLSNKTVSDIEKTKQSQNQQHTGKNDQVNRIVNNLTSEIHAANKQEAKRIDRGKPTLNYNPNATQASNNPSSPKKSLANNSVYNVRKSTHATTIQPSGSSNKTNLFACNIAKTTQVDKEQPTRSDQSNKPQVACNIPLATKTSCRQPTIKNVQGIPNAHDMSWKTQTANIQSTVKKDKASPAVYEIPVSRQSDCIQPTQNISNDQAYLGVSNIYTPATNMQKTRTIQTASNIPRASEINLKPSLWTRKITPGGHNRSRPTQNEHKQLLTTDDKVKPSLSGKPGTKQATDKQPAANNNQLKLPLNKYIYEKSTKQATDKHPTANKHQFKPSASKYTYEQSAAQATPQKTTANSDQLKPSTSKYTYEPMAIQATHKQTANNDQFKPSTSKYTYESRATEATDKQQTANRDQLKPSVSTHLPRETHATHKPQLTINDQVKSFLSKYSCAPKSTIATNNKTIYYDQVNPSVSIYTKIPKLTQASHKQQSGSSVEVQPSVRQVRLNENKYACVQGTTNKKPTRNNEQVKMAKNEYISDRSAPQAKQLTKNNEQVKLTMSEYTYDRSEPQITYKQTTRKNEQVKLTMSEYTHDRSIPQATNKQPTKNKDLQIKPTISEYMYNRSAPQAKQPTRRNEQVRPTSSEYTKPTVSNIHEATHSADKQLTKNNDLGKVNVSNKPSTSQVVKQLAKNNNQVKLAVSNNVGSIQGSNKQPVGNNTLTNLSALNNVYNINDPKQVIAHRLHHRRMKMISPTRKYQRMVEIKRFNDFLIKAQQDFKKKEQAKKDQDNA